MNPNQPKPEEDGELFNEDGYPTEYALKLVEKYGNEFKYTNLIKLLQELWRYPDYIVVKGKRIIKLELHTGGWSGNESIIDTLYKTIFWMHAWQKLTRGGHYYFRFRLDLK